jgi:hypothetical protein
MVSYGLWKKLRFELASKNIAMNQVQLPNNRIEGDVVKCSARHHAPHPGRWAQYSTQVYGFHD